MKKLYVNFVVSLVLALGSFASDKKVSMFFSHDIHSHLDNVSRASSIINDVRKTHPNVFLFDGGDFSMGTLYQMLFTTEASELRTLGALGYDAITLGNHEFDYGSQGLHDTLLAAKNSHEYVPRLVLANIDWQHSLSGSALIKQAFDEYGASEYTIVERDGVRIAVFGLFGKNSLDCAPTCELAFFNTIEASKRIIQTIKKNETVDMIVCLSHCGVNKKHSLSEDELLAESIPELDVIISGHAHTLFETPIVKNETFIVSSGSYAKHLGFIELTQKENGRWKLDTYTIFPIDKSVPKDERIAQKLLQFEKKIDTTKLHEYNLSSSEVLAYNSEENSVADTGYLLADTMQMAIEDLEVQTENSNISGTDIPLDMVCVPNGCVRGIYDVGNVTVKDAFASYSLGIGPDGKTGYPLVSVFIKGNELQNIVEIDASISPFLSDNALFLNRLVFHYNPHRFILNKVNKLEFITNDGSIIPIDNKKLYRIAVDLYTAKMLGSILKMTKGLMTIVPRDANGNEIQDFTKQIIYTKNGELKGWQAISYGLQKMKIIQGYKGSRALHKIKDTRLTPTSLFSHTSKTGYIIYAIALVIIACVIFAIIAIVRAKKNRQQNT